MPFSVYYFIVLGYKSNYKWGQILKWIIPIVFIKYQIIYNFYHEVFYE